MKMRTATACLALMMASIILPASAGAFVDPLSQFSPPALLGQGGLRSSFTVNPFIALANQANLGLMADQPYHRGNVLSYYGKTIDEASSYLLGATCPVFDGILSVGYMKMSLSDIVYASAIDGDGRPTAYGTASAGEDEIFLGYGQKIDWLKFGFFDEAALGGRLKYYTQVISGLDNASAKGRNLDLGFLFKKGNAFVSLEQANVLPASFLGGLDWGTGKRENFSRATRIGLGLTAPEWNLSGGLQADVSWDNLPISFQAGGEYQLFSLLPLRLGVSTAKDGDATVFNFSAGLGIKLGNFFFDYAYQQQAQVVSNCQFFSLAWQI